MPNNMDESELVKVSMSDILHFPISSPAKRSSVQLVIMSNCGVTSRTTGTRKSALDVISTGSIPEYPSSYLSGMENSDVEIQHVEKRKTAPCSLFLLFNNNIPTTVDSLKSPVAISMLRTSTSQIRTYPPTPRFSSPMLSQRSLCQRTRKHPGIPTR